jgi:hypothetical protein
MGSKGNSKSKGKNKPKPRGKRGRGARKRPLQLIDRENAERSELSIRLVDAAGETASFRKPQSWRNFPRKRSAASKARREEHFLQREHTAQQLRTAQREQTAQQLRTTRAKSSAKPQRTAEAPQCSRRRSTAASSGQPQPPSQSEQEEASESEAEADFLPDEIVEEAEEATTIRRLKQELRNEIRAFQSQRDPPSPTRTDDLPDFSPVLSPDEPIVPEVADTEPQPPGLFPLTDCRLTWLPGRLLPAPDRV